MHLSRYGGGTHNTWHSTSIIDDTRKLQALSVVLSHWVVPCTMMEKNGFFSRLEHLYHDRHCVYTLEEYSRRTYNEGLPEVNVVIYAQCMIDADVKVPPCLLCGNRRHLEIEQDSYDIYKFTVTAVCHTWWCDNHQIYIF